MQSLRTVDFWLLFWAVAVGTGSGLVLLNNLAQLAEALGGAQDSQVSSVQLRGSGLGYNTSQGGGTEA